MNNKQRIDKTDSILNTYYADTDRGEDVIDLIADALHYCHKYNISISDVVRIAQQHFQEETKKNNLKR